MVKDMKKVDEFIIMYWSYFQDLEIQMLEIKPFVAFDSKNYKTYSNEFLNIIQLSCSEIDMVGKEIASYIDKSFNPNDANISIYKWWFVIQNWFTSLNLSCPLIEGNNITIAPWDNFKVVTYKDKVGATRFRLDLAKVCHSGGQLIKNSNIAENDIFISP